MSLYLCRRWLIIIMKHYLTLMGTENNVSREKRQVAKMFHISIFKKSH